jgi:16S rRNA processing protein RimM
VYAYQPPAPSLAAGRLVLLERGGVRHAHRVLWATPYRRRLVLVGLEGIEDRDAATALVGARVLVLAEDLPPATADEFYYHEVVGFHVETVSGDSLGTIASTFSTGTSDVWTVRHGAREHLIPVIADVVRGIDRTARRVLIEPLPGLLE